MKFNEYREYAGRNCVNTENTLNENVYIHRARKHTLKLKYLSKFETKMESILGV
jgi:hypothetical protein